MLGLDIMFTHFNERERAIHYPEKRDFYIYVKPYILVIAGGIFFGIILVAWLQYLFFGLPADPSLSLPAITSADPVGFPGWLIMAHWVNFFFLVMIIRSGLSILVDHPRLYWNDGCSPNTEWVRFTPVTISEDKVWTAKEDSRYISPIAGLPGYRHTIGIARVWHFLSIPIFVLNGAVFVVLLFFTNQWERLVPESLKIFPDAWNIWVHYVTFHFPIEPNGFYQYNALQQLAYFSVVFILAPLAMLTGVAMSPAIENRFHWYPKLFGNRQSARSIHYLILLSYCIFIIIHVSLVIATGFARNMNHIVIGSDDASSYKGLYIGIGIVLATFAFGIFAHWLSWNRQRLLQNAESAVNGTLWGLTINRFQPKPYFKDKDISPYFWPNGKMPESEEWKRLAETNFKDYRLKIGGMVGNPVELSMDELKSMNKEQSITMHHCIQGWTGIAEWGGVPMSKIIELVKPDPSATTVAFYSFGEGLFGGVYYDTHTIENCLKPMSILAWEMNYKPLPLIHGAPLRLRVENQLGFKMVKWISYIEFVQTHEVLGKGFGGKNEDDEYFDLLADS
jgi:DMSO/TMAO reductase YedYZ molybdopterin-dependent catalytic subunit/thiosulfate reductase cytochrome b subunit